MGVMSGFAAATAVANAARDPNAIGAPAVATGWTGLSSPPFLAASTIPVQAPSTTHTFLSTATSEMTAIPPLRMSAPANSRSLESLPDSSLDGLPVSSFSPVPYLAAMATPQIVQAAEVASKASKEWESDINLSAPQTCTDSTSASVNSQASVAQVLSSTLSEPLVHLMTSFCAFPTQC